jgi:hypothetical protein
MPQTHRHHFFIWRHNRLRWSLGRRTSTQAREHQDKDGNLAGGLHLLCRTFKTSQERRWNDLLRQQEA